MIISPTPSHLLETKYVVAIVSIWKQTLHFTARDAQNDPRWIFKKKEYNITIENNSSRINGLASLPVYLPIPSNQKGRAAIDDNVDSGVWRGSKMCINRPIKQYGVDLINILF